MPRRKDWKKAAVKRGNVNASREVSERGKYDLCMTEELASLKTENRDNLHDVTEELASLKTEKEDIVQGSVNLVTEKGYLKGNLKKSCDSKSDSMDTDISQFKQAIIDLNKLIENVSSSVRSDFETVILETFPDVNAEYQSRVIEKSYKDKENIENAENIASFLENTMLKQHTEHTEHDKNVIAQHHFNNDSAKTCVNNDLVCYQAVRLSERLWNAGNLVFGSFHQNDDRLSLHSRGFQCTCNALCMLSYSLCHDVDNSQILDKVLCEGDALYQTVISGLKSDGNFDHRLLSLDEIPYDFKVEIGKFTLEKLPIVCGPLIDTQNIGLPTLHDTLQLAFMSVSSGLITIGAICSAVFKKDGMYMFFDSHSHGDNGLSSNDGSSCLITFSSIDDLVTYMYAFYDSLNLDTNLQFDFLPIKIKKSEEPQSCKSKMNSNMEAYFKDQRLKQANKAQNKVQNISSNASNTLIKESKKELKNSKFKHRTEYYKNYKRKCRQNEAFQTRERESKQSARKNPSFKAKETVYQKKSKQSARKDLMFQTRERESKQSARKDPSFKTKEIVYQKESKQCSRKDPSFKTKEIVYQKESKQCARKDPSFKTKEIVYQKESKQCARKDPSFKTKEIVYQKESKQCARKDPSFKTKEIVYQKESKQSARKDPSFKTKEIVYQKESKRSARKDLMFQTRERESKQSARKDPSFKTKEIVYQKESKQFARKYPSFKTKEIVYQKESKQFARKDPSFKTKETVYQKESKQLARENQAFKTKEKAYQNISKKKARENAYVRECERIKKQQVRQEKRKFDDTSEVTTPRKRYKHDTDNFPKTHKKDLKTIEEAIKQFHSDISIGPLYVCSCCHQTWFRKSVSKLMNVHISAESKRQHCTDFISVNNEEWICHTCLSALRDSKIPKLS